MHTACICMCICIRLCIPHSLWMWWGVLAGGGEGLTHVVGGWATNPQKRRLWVFDAFLWVGEATWSKTRFCWLKSGFSEKLTENWKRAFDSSTRFSQGFGWCSTVPPWWSCRVTQVASNTAFPHCQPPPKGTGHMDSLRRKRDLEGHWWLIRMKDTN